ncbi:MAG: transcription elongation factor GreA [Myxococcota bacterium]
MSDREPMTQRGYAALKEELKRLKTVDRPNISAAIEEARAHGDLSENAEYHAAKEKQGFIEGRLKEVESKLALAEIIEPTSLSGDKVIFGATVTVVDLEDDTESTFQIVGLDEADVKKGRISHTSPRARAMIGKRESELFTVRLPKGDKEYEILKVQFI